MGESGGVFGRVDGREEEGEGVAGREDGEEGE